MIQKLLKLADELDKKGLYAEASLLDKIAQQIINIPESAVKPIVGYPLSQQPKSKPGPMPQPVKIDPFAKTPPIPQVQLPPKEYKPVQLADDFVQNIEDWEAELQNMEISPEAREKEREYKKHEVPTDPSELSELGDEKAFKEKMLEHYSPDVDLLLKMPHKSKEMKQDVEYHEYDDSPYKDF